MNIDCIYNYIYTLNLMRQPAARLLSQQQLYLTSKVLLRHSTDLTTLRIRVTHKPITLRHVLTNIKETNQPHDRQGAVYRITCTDCQATYIGETSSNLKTRLTEHKRATKNGDTRNHISEHYRLSKHKIDWDSAGCVTYSTNYQQRLTLESWYTNSEQEPLNQCQQLHLTNDSYITSNETDKQTVGGSKIIAKQQPTNHYNFHVLITNHIATNLTNPNEDQRH